MAYNTPNTPTNTAPKGLDVVIKRINDSINLTWLTKFGKSYIVNDKPKIREYGKNEYKDLSPNDTLLRGNIGATAFWKVSDNFEQLEYEKATNKRLYTRECTLIVWANINKIYPNNPTLTGENLIADILASLKYSNNDFEVTNVVEGNEVWSAYDIETKEHYFELPYHTIAITGNVIYNYNETLC